MSLVVNKSVSFSITKQKSGWYAVTDITLKKDQYDNRLRLLFITRKHNSSLVSYAWVDTIDKRGMSEHKVYEDFSKNLIITDKRCNEKNIKAQHDLMLSMHFDDVLSTVKKQYELV